MKRRITKLLAVSTLLLSGCVTSTFERSAYSSKDNSELLAEILVYLIKPSDSSIYAKESARLANHDIDWQDAARFSSACQLRKMRNQATRTDLEIIHFLWVRNAGNENSAAAAVKASLGEDKYRSAVEVYAGGSFDCQLETLRFIDSLKST